MSTQTILQIVAVAAAMSGSVFTIFKWRACWVAYMVSNISAVILFFISDLHILIIQYLIFIPLNIIGWIRWTRDKKGEPIVGP